MLQQVWAAMHREKDLVEKYMKAIHVGTVLGQNTDEVQVSLASNCLYDLRNSIPGPCLLYRSFFGHIQAQSF